MSIWAAWILQGRSRSVLIISATGLLGVIISPFAVISGAVVTLIALRNRLPEIAVVLLAACGICAGFLWITLGRPEIALQLLLFWSLSAMAAIVLRRSSNLVLAMLVPMVAGFVVVMCVFAVFPEPAAFWKDVLVRIFGVDPDNPGIDQQARLMTGLVAAMSTAGMSACLFLGRWWQCSLYNPGGFEREFLNLRFGRAISLLIVGLCALFLWNRSELVFSVWCVLMALYAFQGLALAHAFARARALNALVIVVFYVVLLLSVYAKLLLSVVGIVDAWIDVRKRWLRGPSSV